jgi:hypothetical protein
MGESEEPRPGFLQIVGVFGQRGSCQMTLLSSTHLVVNTTWWSTQQDIRRLFAAFVKKTARSSEWPAR